MRKSTLYRFVFLSFFIAISFKEIYAGGFSTPQIEIIAFPNPFNEGVSLEIISLNTRPTELRVFDIIGKEREKIELSQLNPIGVYHVQLSDLPAGIYFCNLYADKKLLGSKKIISIK